jgi:hypothetical protein
MVQCSSGCGLQRFLSIQNFKYADYERSAIIEATHMVDGYYSWMTTHGKTQTSIVTFLISYLKF